MMTELNWIVIPGGPGLSNIYLKKSLRDLMPGMRLHFYDMYGSPESEVKNPDLKQIMSQLQIVAESKGLHEYGIIAHSFGSYVALTAAQSSAQSIKAILMLNPMPFEKQLWQTAVAKLVAKIPEETLQRINKTSDGTEVFKILYSFYTGNPSLKLPIDVPFDMQECNYIAEKIQPYDYRSFIISSPIPMIRITGSEDPFYSDDGLMQDKTIVMNGIGHYPFFEAPNLFSASIQKAYKLFNLQVFR